MSSVPSGISALDVLLQDLRLGDNVVWQVDSLEDYRYFVEPFVASSIAQGYEVVYLRFAQHPPILAPREGLAIIDLDPSQGFDFFSRAVHEIIEERGRRVMYIFDNLSSLAVEWATDELLANFFQVTCPFLFELDTVTYFALTRGRHAHSAVARIRDTTQVLIDVYHVKKEMFVHPLKVWDRYSPQMFLPHRVTGAEWAPVAYSSEAAELGAQARRYPLQSAVASIAPWESVYRKLAHYREAGAHVPESHPEIAALKSELSHMLFGSAPQFVALADRYFTIDDLLAIRDRMIGSGRIGGKAAGMLLARRILQNAGEQNGIDFRQVLEGHDSFYIGSDVFFTFLVNNDLFRLRLQMTREGDRSPEAFAEVEKRFLAGSFPHQIVEQFRDILDYFGQAPIIVRSSSLLEDSFGNAFAGKYRSEFCVNQGNSDERLEAFMRAVKLVYASALNPNALSYRRRRGLDESDEQMAILVQRVSGMPHGRYFFPTLAGVAFSKNLYIWNDRIDPAQGMIRLVFGLGTRAVDRVAGDYPRMIAVSNPELRPEVGRNVAKYSQRFVDLLNLQENELTTEQLPAAIGQRGLPGLHLLVSLLEDGYLYDPVSNYVKTPARNFVLTFNNLIRRTRFVEVIGAMLNLLEEAYGRPIDTEFTGSVGADGFIRINLLQCRPLFLPGPAHRVDLPENHGGTLFASRKMMRGGVAQDIRYLVYIDPRRYGKIPTLEMKKSLGRLVGRINEHPAITAGRMVLMGPGRWGSNNIDLGVNVGYADIDNSTVLVEIAREDAGQLPEVSYGTHFFQDLVESDIIFLAVYPDDPAAAFNETFFEEAPNVLADLLPDAAPFADYVKVIDVPATKAGAHIQVIADAQNERAEVYLG